MNDATRETARVVAPERTAILAAFEALETELRVSLRLGAQADKVRAIRNATNTAIDELQYRAVWGGL
jgi:hypothetical protein